MPAKNSVWVWAEQYQKLNAVSLALVGKAVELGQQLGGAEVSAVLAGAGAAGLAKELIDCGASKVFVAEDVSMFDTEGCASLMTGLVRTHRPEIVLWGATSLGRETAARVAARLGTGLTAHCIDLHIAKIDGQDHLVMSVAGWGGNLLLKIVCPERKPQMATVKPGIFQPPPRQPRHGEVIPVEAASGPARYEILAATEEPEEATSLERAAVVVAGGWGLNDLAGFALVEELAKVMNGSVAGTRPAVDAGWIPANRMVGQSGKTVAPRFLVTLGVSGAPQFATGALNAGFILAIDKNPAAPIFEMADLGIVGDLREVLPRLIEELRK
ncbi:MAG: electron transfer flavoprotein subunit alpha/FixB family protein [Chloroflexi bacterium]|nr:electron transfer flavoprotein subunit alpha/FixB family protein [Chloroflexota bacterium]